MWEALARPPVAEGSARAPQLVGRSPDDGAGRPRLMYSRRPCQGKRARGCASRRRRCSSRRPRTRSRASSACVRGRFLTYWTSTSGSICDNDVMALHEILQEMGPQETLTLFVKSGRRQRHGRAAPRPPAAPAREEASQVVAPLNCASAATMLALGADSIAMGPLSFLTAVDTSLEHDLSPLDHTNNLVAVEQRRGGPRRSACGKETRGRDRVGVHPHQELLQVPAPAGGGRARPGQQPLAHAVPRDPRLPHEGPAQDRPHQPPAQLELSRAPVPDHQPRGAPAGTAHHGPAGGPGPACSRS